MAELRRTQAGPFGLDRTVTLEALEQAHAEGGAEALDAFLQPVDSGLEHWPEVGLSEHAAYYWLHGQPVRARRRRSSVWFAYATARAASSASARSVTTGAWRRVG